MRRNNGSCHPENWTNEKLFSELNSHANLETFCVFVYDGIDAKGDQCADAIREATRLYRQSWMQPLINELAKRMKVELK